MTSQDLPEAEPESVTGTEFHRGRATLVADRDAIKAVLGQLQGRGYTFLASLHGVDYYPEEPRLGVLYELLDIKRVDRITVKARVPTDDPRVATVTEI